MKALLIDPAAKVITEVEWAGRSPRDAAAVLGIDWVETVPFDARHILILDEEGMLKDTVRSNGALVDQQYMAIASSAGLLLLAGVVLLVGIKPDGGYCVCTATNAQLRARVDFIRDRAAAAKLAHVLIAPIVVDDNEAGRKELVRQLHDRERQIRELVARDGG